MFKVGQKVKCVVDGFSQLAEGKQYTIEKVSTNKQFVAVTECEEWFATERFEAIPEVVPPFTYIDNEHVYAFDIDDTLVLWKGDYQQPGEGRVAIVDPYDGVAVYLIPHKRHIKLVRQMKGRGRFVMVWSAGGAKWAAAVIEALGLSDAVDLIITKPTGYVDDLPAQEFLKNHIYIEHTEEDV